MKKYLFLIFVLIIAFVLRFYRLSDYPALNADEAAIGYNAYSLLLTGKDEHGNPWPIHFQSFNDYKPGLFFYIVLPFVKVLGLNEWAVRIPGATLGVLAVLGIYFLTREIFPEVKTSIFKYKISLAEVAALFLAVSPWHIHFSRGGWEVNAATTFMVWGGWLIIRSKNYNFRFKELVWGMVFLIASLYTYHSARIVAPLLGIFLIGWHWRVALKNYKKVLAAGLIGLLLTVPLVISLRNPAIASRATGVGIFTDPGPLNRANEQRGEHGNYNSPLAKILHNKPVNYGLVFLSNWAKHFSGSFLFISGDDIQRNKVPETGQLYLFEIATLAVGLWAVFAKPKNWEFILFWMVIGPVAAALTFQSPHALRSQNMVIPLEIISAYGFIVIMEAINTKLKIKKVLLLIQILAVLVLGWSVARYLHLYYVHMAKEYPYSSQYGVKDLVKFVVANDAKYPRVVVTDRYDQPYILFLFYLKYPPKDFQADHRLTGRDQFGFSTVGHFGKFYFTSIDLDKTRNENPKALIAGTPEELPAYAVNKIGEIDGPNGKPLFILVDN